MFWTGIPFVRFTIALAGGISVAYFFRPSLIFTISAAVLCLLIFLSLHFFLSRKEGLKFKAAKGITALFFLFLGGNILLISYQKCEKEGFQDKKQIEFYEAVLLSEADEKENFFRINAEIKQVFQKGEWRPAKAKIILYFNKRFYKKPKTGQAVIVKGMPSQPQPSRNPGEFDYAAFLASKNITFTHFLYNGQAQYRQEGEDFPLLQAGMSIRNYCLEKLDDNLPEKQASIAAALLLGTKKDLPDDIRENYASTGLMHLLAVSGLHTGIIYQLLVVLLGPLRKRKIGKFVFALSCITGLWGYALITGFSASVLRAAFMFSCFLLAGTLNRKPSAFNTLALSAFCLLLWNPFLLFDVGFQLSYAAVVGILLVLPLITELFPVSGKVASYFRDMAGISIAAQVFTFPLAIYYFHQFPVYFLFSNLAIVPVAVLSVYCGVLMLAVAQIPLVVDIVAYILKNLLIFQEFLVSIFSSLPAPVIMGSFSFAEMILVFFLVFLLIVFLKTKRLEIAKYAVFVSSIFAVLKSISIYSELSREQLIVLHEPGHSIIAYVNGDNAVLYADSSFLKKKNKVEQLRKNFISYNVHSLKWLTLDNSRCNLSLKNNRGEKMFLQLNPIKTLKMENYISVYDGFMRKVVLDEKNEVYSTFYNGALIIDINDLKIRSLWN